MSPIPPTDMSAPAAMAAGGQTVGVTVVSKGVSVRENEAMVELVKGNKNVEMSAYMALYEALVVSLRPVVPPMVFSSHTVSETPPEVLRIVVSAKP